VALTANAFDDDRTACFSAGMDDFLSKPIRVEELFETVLRGLLRNQRRLLPGGHLGRDRWAVDAPKPLS
jgi:CheY-like chemotaxis protein